jgi:hypothetical protein
MWQMAVLYAIAGCGVGCLLAIFIAIMRVAKGIFSIKIELAKMNAKLESVEAVKKDESKSPTDPYESELEAIEVAISNFEKLKRIDLTKSAGDKK